MVPADLAARIRMLSEASLFDHDSAVEGRTAVRETQARLSQLLPGQSFVATLQRALPDGTFQAVVAGQNMILALNHSAQAGDTLELVVEKNTANLVFARLAQGEAAARGSVSQTNLSQTGRVISALLAGQSAESSTPLADGQPLLKVAPNAAQHAQTLAPALRQALTQSGLFYEAHQQQWLAGKVQIADLLREPQGRQSPLLQDPALLARLMTAKGRPEVQSNLTQYSSAQAPSSALISSPSGNAKDLAAMARTQIQDAVFPQISSAQGLLQMPVSGGAQGGGFLAEIAQNLERATRTLGYSTLPLEGDGEEQNAPHTQVARQNVAVGREVAQLTKTLVSEAALSGADERAAAARDNGGQGALRTAMEQGLANQAQRLPVPERLAPLVYQQLESMATQNYLMHGVAWPGQGFEWEIEDEAAGRGGDEDEASTWKTTLRVTMPSLGGVEARLTLTRDGVLLRLLADYSEAVDRLNKAQPDLLEALEAANISVSGFVAQKREPLEAESVSKKEDVNSVKHSGQEDE